MQRKAGRLQGLWARWRQPCTATITVTNPKTHSDRLTKKTTLPQICPSPLPPPAINPPKLQHVAHPQTLAPSASPTGAKLFTRLWCVQPFQTVCVCSFSHVVSNLTIKSVQTNTYLGSHFGHLLPPYLPLNNLILSATISCALLYVTFLKWSSRPPSGLVPSFSFLKVLGSRIQTLC